IQRKIYLFCIKHQFNQKIVKHKVGAISRQNVIQSACTLSQIAFRHRVRQRPLLFTQPSQFSKTPNSLL
ncbi:hypothetical protein, partial [Fischerella thermalis]|uniref:hypothetical protein n=1 Tax=Fischerella thermalis TaxID=372787 RepID=UPI001CA58295